MNRADTGSGWPLVRGPYGEIVELARPRRTAPGSPVNRSCDPRQSPKDVECSPLVAQFGVFHTPPTAATPR